MYWVRNTICAAILAVVAALAAGCVQERPDTTFNGQDVRSASDIMVMHLLALPVINQSPARVTIVVEGVENRTLEPFDYNAFMQRARVLISQQAPDRVALIENKKRFDYVQGSELDRQADPSQRVQPQFALYSLITEIRNAHDRYYLCEFRLTDLQTRVVVWDDKYEVDRLD